MEMVRELMDPVGISAYHQGKTAAGQPDTKGVLLCILTGAEDFLFLMIDGGRTGHRTARQAVCTEPIYLYTPDKQSGVNPVPLGL